MRDMMKKLICMTSLVFLLFLTACSDTTTNHSREMTNEEANIAENESPGENKEDEALASKSDAAPLPTDSYQKADEGEAVQSIQESLMQMGYDIEANGKFDMYTVWALTDLQLQ